MDIVAAIQNSIEIAGKLRALAKKVEDAEFKMLVADLSNELAEAKLEVANLKSALAEAKVGALGELQGQFERLNSENEALRSRLEAKEAEARALDAQVQVLAERLSPTAASKLDEVQEKILLALAQNDEVEEDRLTFLLSVGKQVVAYHLEELRSRNFVYANYVAGSEWSGEPSRAIWSIQHPGREYLLRRGMLQ